jgi:hypothetical protein
MTPPVQFSEKIKAARPANGAGYPVQISAWDIDEDFYFATPELPTTTPDGRVNLLSEDTTTTDGHVQRRFYAKLPAGTATNQLLRWDGTEWVPFTEPPTSGTYVLGSIDGALTWIDTEECP